MTKEIPLKSHLQSKQNQATRREYGSTSSSLLEQIKLDDAMAWDRTVKLYAPLVFYWCKQSGLSQEDCFEIGQELFLAIHESLGRFQRKNSGSSFRGWMRTIVMRKISDHYRLNSRRADFASDSLSDYHDLPEQDGPVDGQHDQEKRLLYQRAIQIIEGEFQPKHQRAFELMIIEGWRAKEVAIHLEMSVNAVYMARHHILRRLKLEFADLLD